MLSLEKDWPRRRRSRRLLDHSRLTVKSGRLVPTLDVVVPFAPARDIPCRTPCLSNDTSRVELAAGPNLIRGTVGEAMIVLSRAVAWPGAGGRREQKRSAEDPADARDIQLLEPHWCSFFVRVRRASSGGLTEAVNRGYPPHGGLCQGSARVHTIRCLTISECVGGIPQPRAYLCFI